MAKTFRDLDVYNRAYKIALDVHKISLSFPDIEKFSTADQMRRASKSICANIAEGFAKHHKSAAEFKRFLSMATGSCNEMLVWCQFCHDLDYIDKEQWENWNNEYTELSRMLYSLSKNWKSRSV